MRGEGWGAMSLRAWRAAWMALGAGVLAGHAAVAAPGAPAAPPAPVESGAVSIFDAPPLATASYLAFVKADPDSYGGAHPLFTFERGAFKCGPLMDLLYRSQIYPTAAELAAATKTCDLSLGLGLDQDLHEAPADGAIVVIGPDGHRYTTRREVLAAALPIDTPAKALLAVTLSKYSPRWWRAFVVGEPKQDEDGRRTSQFRGGYEDGHVRAVAGGFEVASMLETSTCNERTNSKTTTWMQVTLVVDATGKLVEKSRAKGEVDHSECVVQFGRRPAGFVDVWPTGSVHGELTRALHHEAESVRAFERLARELMAHDAPAELSRAARAAAGEERVHAARCAALIGARVHIAADTLPVRGLLALAIENAQEGCIGEAFAALANVVQARTAATPELRAHYAAIAADELGHAALAHAVADWLATRLTAAERTAVADASCAALARLDAALARPPTAATRAIGLPAGAEAARLRDLVAARAAVAT